MENNPMHKTSLQSPTPFSQTYFHGTKANLNIRDFIEVGFNSNFVQKKNQNTYS